jgi:hypothetical protein
MTRFTGIRFIVVLAAALSGGPDTAYATMSFEAPLENAYGSNAEYPTTVGDVASDGNGVWIAASHADEDIVYRRSTDGGRSWSAMTQLNDEVALGQGPDYAVQLAASSSRWLAMWSFDPYAGGGVIPEGILVVRSDDSGASWTAAVSIGAETATGYPTELVTDGAGTWILAWIEQTLPGTVRVSRSTDDGETWTSTVLGTSGTEPWGLAAPHLATDGAGRWSVVWHADEDGDAGNVSRAYFATSSDNGQSWSAAALIDGAATIADGFQPYPDIVCDGAGNWAVVWGDFNRQTILLSRSADAMIWTVPESIHQRGPAFVPWPGNEYVSFVSRGSGDWIVAWSTSSVAKIGVDADVVFTHSPDAGATWKPLTALNLSAIRDHGLTHALAPRHEYLSDVAADASGTVVAQYAATTHCCASDNTMLQVSVPDCPASPPAGCSGPDVAGASRLSLRNELLFRDTVLWKWSGPVASPAAFGDPLSTSDYAFCLYDQDGGSDVLVYEGEARAAAMCGEKSCWVEKSAGYSFRDAKNLVGSTRLLSMKSSASATRLIFSGGGPALLAPTLPLVADARVLAVLRNVETGTCWEASFSAPALNDVQTFFAESD